MAPANQNDKEVTIPERLDILANNMVDAYQAQTRTMCVLATHTNYDLTQIHLAACRALMRTALANIMALPDPEARKVMEELAVMTDHAVKHFKNR